MKGQNGKLNRAEEFGNSLRSCIHDPTKLTVDLVARLECHVRETPLAIQEIGDLLRLTRALKPVAERQRLSVTQPLQEALERVIVR